MSVKVGIIEDHTEFRQSLVYLVSSVADFSIAWAFSSVEEALENNLSADLLLLDINLPGMTGLEAIPILKKKFPVQKIIMLTIQEDDYHVFEAIKNGADGYITKKSNPSKILEAIRQVLEGGAALTPMVAKQVMAFLKTPAVQPASPSELTPREKEILALITEGLINDKIADRLFISVQTVRNHIKNIYEKLQVHSRAQVVAKALKDRLV
jgi:DNA-binding NarL/FixJ family response regulator